jgi:hypothetical protein
VPFWGGPLSDGSARAIFSFKFGIAAAQALTLVRLFSMITEYE